MNRIEVTEAFMKDLFKKANPSLESMEGVILMELEEAVRELWYVRRKFASTAKHLSSQLHEAITNSWEAGRQPNVCGVLTAGPELEVLNGRIEANRRSVHALIKIAIKAGLLEDTTYVC